MDEKTRQALEARFPEEAVKKRRGSFGRDINYLETRTVISRLNDCFDSDWSFRILSHEVLETGEVLVHGRLQALGVVKESFGRCASISKDGEVIRALGDCYKSAATESLKVCCRLLGIAAYLYSDIDADTPADTPRQLPRPAANNDRASAKQVSAIWAIGRKLGMDANTIRQRCYDAYACFPEQLDKKAASDFIGKLDAEVQRGAA